MIECNVSGIWADESDEEDDRPGFGRKKKAKADLTEGIDFISGGFKKSATEEAAEAHKVPSFHSINVSC